MSNSEYQASYQFDQKPVQLEECRTWNSTIPTPIVFLHLGLIFGDFHTGGTLREVLKKSFHKSICNKSCLLGS